MSNVIEVRLENVPYGKFLLPMGIDSKSNLYMSYPAIESLYQIRQNSLREKIAAKSLKALLGEDLVSGKIKARILNSKADGTHSANFLTFDLFLKVTAVEARKNDHAFQLLVTGLGDSLRSIALEYFGESAKSEERNAWIGDRQKSKDAFWDLAQAIKRYCKDRPDLSDSYRAWVYSNCQDSINRGLFGKPAKKIREEVCATDLLRDHYGRRALRHLESIQSLASRYIVVSQIEPKEACSKAVDEFAFGTISYKE